MQVVARPERTVQVEVPHENGRWTEILVAVRLPRSDLRLRKIWEFLIFVEVAQILSPFFLWLVSASRRSPHSFAFTRFSFRLNIEFLVILESCIVPVANPEFLLSVEQFGPAMFLGIHAPVSRVSFIIRFFIARARVFYL